MKQVSQHIKSGKIMIEDVPSPTIKEGYVLVQTCYSVISPGTERASVSSRSSSLIQRARKNPEVVLKILEQLREQGILSTYRRVQTKLESLAPLGYSASGVVIAVGGGIKDISVGDAVACAGAGFANHAEFILIPRNLCARIPHGVGFDEAAYTTIGAIALQGVRQASPTIGEVVVVIGLGLLGQLTAQILKAHGCFVIGLDVDPQAVKLAKSCGADIAIGRQSGNAKKSVNIATAGRGADAVIITAATPSNDPVQLAGELCREKGRVILVGDVGLQLPRGPYYTKELDFRISRSYGPGRYDVNYEERGHDYPFGYVRWTENRNMEEFLRLLSKKLVDVQRLTTHRLRIDEAKEAYALLSGTKGTQRERFFGVLLDYEATHVRGDQVVTKIELLPSVKPSHLQPLNVGFLGAGSFAQGSLLGPVQSFPGVKLVGVCTGNGLSAKTVARNFKFAFATTNPKELLDNETIGTIFIATRHNLHAGFVIEALKRGKNVFVEKPLAINEDELRNLVMEFRKSTKSKNPALVMVGFNRNFAPLVKRTKAFFAEATGPFIINYRVNAGYLPPDHWTRDPVEGGGRIVGEVCHFVALLQHFVNANAERVYAENVRISTRQNIDDDSTIITLKFADGSIGTIVYVTNGDQAVPKEFLEISSTGRTAILDNFQRLRMYHEGRLSEIRTKSVQKGHREEIEAFLSAVQETKESPLALNTAIATTQITFKILESLRKGSSIAL